MSDSYLVTGGAGFIGSNIVEALVNQGETVKVIDDLSTGHIDNIKSFMDNIEFIKGSICDRTILKDGLEDVDFVLHQAAIPSVPRSIARPSEVNNVNISGTLTLLNACRESNVKKIVFASSSSVYGSNPTLPKVETMESMPLSPYALTKHTGEHYCRLFSEIYDLDVVSLRYFNVFGPRQNPNSEYSAVIPKFVRMIMAGEQPIVFGDGTQSRDFTYVANVVKANLLSCKANNVSGNVFNIATGTRINLIQLVERINDILGKSIEPKFINERQGDVKHSLADISKAKLKLGYEPEILFEEGLNKTIEVFQNGKS